MNYTIINPKSESCLCNKCCKSCGNPQETCGLYSIEEKYVIVDMKNKHYINSSFASQLIFGLIKNDKIVYIVNCHRQPMETIKLIKLNTYINFRNSVDDAIAEISRGTI